MSLAYAQWWAGVRAYDHHTQEQQHGQVARGRGRSRTPANSERADSCSSARSMIDECLQRANYERSQSRGPASAPPSPFVTASPFHEDFGRMREQSSSFEPSDFTLNEPILARSEDTRAVRDQMTVAASEKTYQCDRLDPESGLPCSWRFVDIEGCFYHWGEVHTANHCYHIDMITGKLCTAGFTSPKGLWLHIISTHPEAIINILAEWDNLSRSGGDQQTTNASPDQVATSPKPAAVDGELEQCCEDITRHSEMPVEEITPPLSDAPEAETGREKSIEQGPTPKPARRRRTHACDTCGKSFTRGTLLTKHRTTHSDERPFVCTVDGCDQTFKHQNERTRHQGAQHGPKQFVCGGRSDGGQAWGCGKAFARLDGLKDHHAKTSVGAECLRARDMAESQTLAS